jgi:hypothetical protein
LPEGEVEADLCLEGVSGLEGDASMQFDIPTLSQASKILNEDLLKVVCDVNA